MKRCWSELRAVWGEADGSARKDDGSRTRLAQSAPPTSVDPVREDPDPYAAEPGDKEKGDSLSAKGEGDAGSTKRELTIRVENGKKGFRIRVYFEVLLES